MKKAILILLVINLGICFVIAQPYFSKTYRFTENSSIADQLLLIEEEIFVKYSAICNDNVECSGVSKVSSNGEIIWNKGLSTIDAAPFNGVGFFENKILLAGHSRSDSASHLSITEFSNNGDTSIIFQNVSNNNRVLMNLLKVSNSEINLVGYDFNSEKIVLFKLIDNNLVEEKSLIFESLAQAPIEIRLFNEKLFLLSHIQLKDFKSYSILIELDTNFNVTNNYQLREISPTSPISNFEIDSNFIYVTQGFFQSDDITMNRNPPILYKIDSTGNIVWELEFRTRHYKALNDLIVAENGDIICVGVDRSRDRELWDFDMGWIIRVSDEGELLWEKSVIDTRYDFHGRGSFEAIEEAPNGDLIIGGWIADTTAANTNNLTLNAWLLRLTSEGCFFDNCDSTQIITNVNSIVAGLPHFDIHPNPITDLIKINPANEEEYSLTIYNVTGKPLYSRQNLKNEHIINARRFGKGIYFLKLTQDGKVISRKLIKQ